MIPLHTILRLGLIHVAVALTLVPINGTLNRIMISELKLSATLVGALIALPYLCAPLQVVIGNFSDRYPLFGYRRTPYIILGLLLCVGGTALAPLAAYGLAADVVGGLPLGVLAFGCWGLGFTCSTVGYLSLATDLSGEGQRARVTGVMWFMLIASVIIAAIVIALSLSVPATSAEIYRAVWGTCGVALLLGLLGVIGLEPRNAPVVAVERRSFATLWRTMRASQQASRFFVYLIVLLIAILGQDLLLEPYAADVFGVPTRSTTQYTAIWGIALLVALLLANPLVRRVGNVRGAALGGGIAIVGLLLIAVAGISGTRGLLIPGLVVFGFGSGLSTATNLALMLDMTLPGQIGLFIGAWGMADALARLGGTLLSGLVRDLITELSGSVPWGYISVFLIEAALLGVSLWLLRGISTTQFHQERAPSTGELAGLVGETQG
jgi:MFS transporter, BCD family, chlorophyll transporter